MTQARMRPMTQAMTQASTHLFHQVDGVVEHLRGEERMDAAEEEAAVIAAVAVWHDDGDPL